MAKEKEFDKDYDKLMKKNAKTQKRLEENRKKVGKHYKETEYSTPKEARKGAMLQKKGIEEHQRNVRRSKVFSEKYK